MSYEEICFRRINSADNDTIPYQLEQLEIPCFPHIKESGFFLSASGTGLPVHLYRPDDKIIKSFDPIVKEIVKHLKKK